MKRDEIKAKIPGITDEQLQWLMDENGRDINADKKRADDAEAKVADLTARLKTATDGLKAFDGVDVEQLRGQITQLQDELKQQADAFAFDSALDGAIREAKGRDVKAIRGMLDLDALRSSKDRTADISSALTRLAETKAWAFETSDGQKKNPRLSSGGEHGDGGEGQETDGVISAFQALNPGYKL